MWDGNSVQASSAAILTVLIQMRVTPMAQAICTGSSLILGHHVQPITKSREFCNAIAKATVVGHVTETQVTGKSKSQSKTPFINFSNYIYVVFICVHICTEKV